MLLLFLTPVTRAFSKAKFAPCPLIALQASMITLGGGDNKASSTVQDEEEMLEDAFWRLTEKHDAVLQVVDSVV